MSRADSDKSMETVHLSEEPTNNYEEITVEPRTSKKEIIYRASHYQKAVVVCCLATGTAILIVIVVELVNAFNNNPYL